MRTQNFTKLLLSILVGAAFCAAAVVLTAQALSRVHAQRPAAELTKASAPDGKPAQPDRATAGDESAKGTSWKQWPTLTDF